jgi:hypothetical protein
LTWSIGRSELFVEKKPEQIVGTALVGFENAARK